MLNGHGDDIYKSNTEIKANFSTNVWYDADTDILPLFSVHYCTY